MASKVLMDNKVLMVVRAKGETALDSKAPMVHRVPVHMLVARAREPEEVQEEVQVVAAVAAMGDGVKVHITGS